MSDDDDDDDDDDDEDQGEDDDDGGDDGEPKWLRDGGPEANDRILCFRRALYCKPNGVHSALGRLAYTVVGSGPTRFPSWVLFGRLRGPKTATEAEHDEKHLRTSSFKHRQQNRRRMEEEEDDEEDEEEDEEKEDEEEDHKEEHGDEE